MFRSLPRALRSSKNSEPTPTRIRSDPDMPTRTVPTPPVPEASPNQEPVKAPIHQETPKSMTFRQRLANLKNLPAHYKMLFIVQGFFMLGALYVRMNMQLQLILKEEREKQMAQESEELEKGEAGKSSIGS
jgi:hypothetical protein